ncbi:MAG: acetyltransferase [Chthoniobacteraceae bacterium]
MARHFAFNGDADGLCALQQFRLGESDPVSLVTGVKRDIGLVGRVRARPGDELTVLDISFEPNAKSVLALLASGVTVRYFDHHFPGALATHPELELHIQQSPEVCTSLIVNAHLQSRWPLWAAVGAFGDNLDSPARTLAGSAGLSAEDTELLRSLGICLNYNSYGESEDDLLIAPAELHLRLIRFQDPCDFARNDALFEQLRTRYLSDLENANRTKPLTSSDSAAVYVLPDMAWSRRVSGTWAHYIANENPLRAHAVLTHSGRGGFTVSVRAAKVRPRGAAEFCRKFDGGGREAAAGINHMPAEALDGFGAEFLMHFR